MPLRNAVKQYGVSISLNFSALNMCQYPDQITCMLKTPLQVIYATHVRYTIQIKFVTNRPALLMDGLLKVCVVSDHLPGEVFEASMEATQLPSKFYGRYREAFLDSRIADAAAKAVNPHTAVRYSSQKAYLEGKEPPQAVDMSDNMQRNGFHNAEEPMVIFFTVQAPAG